MLRLAQKSTVGLHRVKSRAGLRKGGDCPDGDRERNLGSRASLRNKRKGGRRRMGPCVGSPGSPRGGGAAGRAGVQGCSPQTPHFTPSWRAVVSAVFCFRPLVIICNFPLKVPYSWINNLRIPKSHFFVRSLKTGFVKLKQ